LYSTTSAGIGRHLPVYAISFMQHILLSHSSGETVASLVWKRECCRITRTAWCADHKPEIGSVHHRNVKTQ